MEQKTIWVIYSKLGNRLMGILLLIFSTISCEHSDFDWKTITKITYINETLDVIFVEGVSCKVPNILPNDTLVYEHTQLQSGTSKSDKPSLDNLGTFVPCAFFYGNTRKCEREVNVREAQENHKQTGELEFEYTFRFTELGSQNATVCM